MIASAASSGGCAFSPPSDIICVAASLPALMESMNSVLVTNG